MPVLRPLDGTWYPGGLTRRTKILTTRSFLAGPDQNPELATPLALLSLGLCLVLPGLFLSLRFQLLLQGLVERPIIGRFQFRLKSLGGERVRVSPQVEERTQVGIVQLPGAVERVLFNRN